MKPKSKSITNTKIPAAACALIKAIQTPIMKTIHLLLAAGFLPAVLPSAQGSVEIPDPLIERAVREQLEKPTGAITQSDMESLKKLRVWPGGRDEHVRTLAGLEFARNLESLSISGRPAVFLSHCNDCGPRYPLVGEVDFSPLAGMSRLTTLALNYNQLTSLTLPEGLRNLEVLELQHSQALTALTLPSDATRLVTLELTGAPMLEELYLPPSPSLILLDLRGNQLNDLSFLESTPGLLRLNLAHNGLAEVRLPESGLPNLEQLDVSHNPLAELSFLESLPHLGAVNLAGTGADPATFRVPLATPALWVVFDDSWADLVCVDPPQFYGSLRLEVQQLRKVDPDQLEIVVTWEATGAGAMSDFRLERSQDLKAWGWQWLNQEIESDMVSLLVPTSEGPGAFFRVGVALSQSAYEFFIERCPSPFCTSCF